MSKCIRMWLMAGMLVILASASSYAQSPAGGVADSLADTAGHKIIVYYLYFMPRCQTCLNIETFAREAVESGFPEEFKHGLIEWHAYDTDKEEFRHYWDDFKLDTKSLVMVDMQNGKPVRWKNCVQVWNLVENKPEFQKYVQDEVRLYLKD